MLKNKKVEREKSHQRAKLTAVVVKLNAPNFSLVLLLVQNGSSLVTTRLVSYRSLSGSSCSLNISMAELKFNSCNSQPSLESALRTKLF